MCWHLSKIILLPFDACYIISHYPISLIYFCLMQLLFQFLNFSLITLLMWGSVEVASQRAYSLFSFVNLLNYFSHLIFFSLLTQFLQHSPYPSQVALCSDWFCIIPSSEMIYASSLMTLKTSPQHPICYLYKMIHLPQLAHNPNHFFT